MAHRQGDDVVHAVALGALGQLTATGFDLVLNATAASLSSQLPQLPSELIGPRTVCYDLAYSLRETSFVGWARRHGASAAYDGLGMLVEQAAEAFRLWHGIRPDTAAVLRALRADLPRREQVQ